MQKKLFNITKEEIKEKKYNIFIGISIGVLKPLSKSMISEYIAWSLERTQNNIVILIADEITKYNYRVFSKYSTGKSKKRAMLDGKKYVKYFQEFLQNIPENDRKRIDICRWHDIWDNRKEKIRQILEEEYNSNETFKNKILLFANKNIERRGRKLNRRKIEFLSQYILDELPTLLDGIKYNGILYNLLLYPTFQRSGMSEFVMEICLGEKFPCLFKNLNFLNKTALVEDYIPISK